MTMALVIAAIVSSARHVNPHSRLRSKVRRRRSRQDFHGEVLVTGQRISALQPAVEAILEDGVVDIAL